MWIDRLDWCVAGAGTIFVAVKLNLNRDLGLNLLNAIRPVKHQQAEFLGRVYASWPWFGSARYGYSITV